MTPAEKEQERYIRRQKRRCERKTAHPSLESAMKAGKKAIHRGGCGSLYAYQCLYCRAFHLTRNSGNGWPVHYEAKSA